MARADNKSPIRGTTITTDDLNEKFSDITEVTSGHLNQDNFRNESVDQPHLVFTDSTSGAQDYILKGYGTMSNECWQAPWNKGTGILASGEIKSENYTHSAASNVRALSHTNPGPAFAPTTSPASTLDLSSSPLSFAYGDTLRVYWELEVLTRQSSIDTTADVPYPYSTIDFPAFWLVWLQWDIGSGWTEVPNQASFTSDPTYVKDSNSSHGTMVIPHEWAVNKELFDGNAPLAGMALDALDVGHRSAWYYKNPGSTVTVSGLRLVIDGLFKAGGGDAGSRFYRDGDWDDANSVNVGQISMTTLQMKDLGG